jgi:hypothetical protein
MRAVLRRFVVRPLFFILPQKKDAAVQDDAGEDEDDDDEGEGGAREDDPQPRLASAERGQDMHVQATRHVA